MALLTGRNGLVFGVANERSLAWHIARNLLAHGACCGFSYYPGPKAERRVRRALERAGLSEPWLHPCDLADEAQIDALFEAVERQFGHLAFVIHSVALADRDYLRIGAFADTPRRAFAEALDVSAYSLIAIARRARRLMPEGGSIVALSYLGSERVVPGYNLMGVAKAALEAIARYLAAELGRDNIRVNTLSPGPCRTLSTMVIDNFDELLAWTAQRAPLQRAIDPDEVGRSAVYLVSDLASGVTGQNIYVDAGYHIVGL